MNLVAWLDYLNQLPPLPQPEAIRILPRVIREGWRQWSCPVITITGTNGKGSTATLVSAILRAQGMRVACYTSPHLFDFRERLRILGKICSESAWRQAFEWVQAGQQPDEYYSFFDWVTLAALYLCQQQALDVLILEVGVGGRLDAVNAVDPDISVITGVALDHTTWLGHDRESIGREKMGICRVGRPLICGDPAPPETVRAEAKRLQVQWYGLGEQFFVTSDHRNAHFHPHNMATAIQTARCCQPQLTTDTIQRGIVRAVLPGRLERWHAPIPIVWDVAHNPEACAYSASVLSSGKRPKRRYALFSMLNDKLIQASLQALTHVVDEWHVFPLDTVRAGSSEQLAEAFLNVKIRNVIYYDTPDAAVAALHALYQPGDEWLVTGSFHTVAVVRQLVVGMT